MAKYRQDSTFSEDSMKLAKVINNNIVSAFDDDGREVIVMGRGLGFKTKELTEIPEDKIEKVFRIEDAQTANQLKTLFKELPLEHIRVTTDIINYAKSFLNKRMNQSIYVTLADHINFAVERKEQNLMFTNPLLREIKSFYRQEYVVGEYAIALIKERLGIEFPVDEAASIALHIVNAEYNTAMGDTIHITTLIQNVVAIVREYFNITLDERSLNYERFITHLKFLSQRVFSKELLDSENEEFSTVIAKMYPEEFMCSNKIKAYIYETYGHIVTDEEVAYLAVHIKRIRV